MSKLINFFFSNISFYVHSLRKESGNFFISLVPFCGDKTDFFFIDEFCEFLATFHSIKLMNSQIHDVELGSESPTISTVTLQNVDVNKELSTLNNFVFEFDISYVGGFYMAIEALMKFNSNAAFVSVKGN